VARKAPPRDRYKSYPRAKEFELKDQFKNPHAFALPREKVTVLMFGDRKGSDYAEPWTEALWDRYKERISMEGVGVGRWIPIIERPLIRLLIRRATDYPIMLDWKGKVAKTYYFQRKQLNLFVIEPGGGIVRKLVGPPTAENIRIVCQVIDRLLEDFGPE